MIFSLAILYPIAVLYNRGGRWHWLAPFTVLALVLDVMCNYSEISLLYGRFPVRGDWTYSSRIERDIFDRGYRGKISRFVAGYLNYFSPNHIRNYA